jgi:hypothetical protein
MIRRTFALNALSGTRGRVWHPESYDAWLRDANDLRRVRQYILDNPVKARLTDWRWIGDPDVGGLLVPAFPKG